MDRGSMSKRIRETLGQVWEGRKIKVSVPSMSYTIYETCSFVNRIRLIIAVVDTAY